MRDAWHRLVPFALAALLIFLTDTPKGASSAWSTVAPALTVLVFVTAALVPWGRLSRLWQAVPPLAYFSVVLLVRLTEDRLAPATGALVLLPVLWPALHGTRGQVKVALGMATLAFLGPVLLVDPALLPEEARSAASWSVVAWFVGLGVHRLVEQTRHAEAEASRRADTLSQREKTLRSVAELARQIFRSPDAREAICTAAAQVAQADFAYLLEPHGRELVAEARSATDLPDLRIVLGAEASGAAIAYTSGRPFKVLRAREHVAVSQRLTQATGARSLLFQPVLRDDEAVGVLAVGWREPLPQFPDHLLAALDLLAAEATVAIERADLVADLKAEARRDTLTGLWNRRAWDERLAEELARARRCRSPLALALLDLDHFKAYNDRYGHPAGDRLLKGAAAAWRSQLRASDLLARWGGEEFAVLLPGCGSDEAYTLLERVRTLTPDGQTCSAGIAGWDGQESPESLIQRADQALYTAKHAGRDRAVVARSPIRELVVEAPELGVELGEHRMST